MSVLCLGEVWLELNAAMAPELTETFRAQTGGWGAGFCRRYAALGGQAALLAQLGADSFGCPPRSVPKPVLGCSAA